MPQFCVEAWANIFYHRITLGSHLRSTGEKAEYPGRKPLMIRVLYARKTRNQFGRETKLMSVPVTIISPPTTSTQGGSGARFFNHGWYDLKVMFFREAGTFGADMHLAEK